MGNVEREREKEREREGMMRMGVGERKRKSQPASQPGRKRKEHLRIRKHPFFSMCKTFEHRIHCGR